MEDKNMFNITIIGTKVCNNLRPGRYYNYVTEPQ